MIDTDARASSYPAPRAPDGGNDGGNDFSQKKKAFPLPRVGATRTFASAVVFDDIDALFREARELVLGDDGDEAPDDELKRSATKLCPDDATENDATENVVLKNKNDARAATFTSLDANGAETKTTPKTPCVFNTTYARLGSRVSDTVITNGERPPDDSDLLPGWSFTGVTKDTKFRKRCPMHEGPCADCGARCRVPFRPTRGAARGRDDPLCPRCLVARKEHRKTATERDWK